MVGKGFDRVAMRVDDERLEVRRVDEEGKEGWAHRGRHVVECGRSAERQPSSYSVHILVLLRRN
jgi:hypothetical protein